MPEAAPSKIGAPTSGVVIRHTHARVCLMTYPIVDVVYDVVRTGQWRFEYKGKLVRRSRLLVDPFQASDESMDQTVTA
eukprot:183512-Pleurochrysis_carterae.AAC.11